jgi:LysM repeat protein
MRLRDCLIRIGDQKIQKTTQEERMKVTRSFLNVAILLCIAWPAWAETYAVQRGDTLGKIAKTNESSVSELARINGIVNINLIKVGQKIEIPERGSRKVDRQIVSLPAAGVNYAHVYKHEMGKPFAPRKNGVQKKLSGKEYNRHMSNIMRHGISKEGARAILAAKENGLSAGEVFLPNGTIVESVSFGRDEVWIGGVLINVKAGGIKAIRYVGWTGESILDALNCGNYINPRKVHVPKGVPTVEEQIDEIQESRPIVKPPSPGKKPCPNCPDELEFDSGLYFSVHDPSGEAETKGFGLFGEILFWRNFANDCSSEYWWGAGALGSAYWYSATNAPSEGNGSRLAVQAGVKRTWNGGDEMLARQWIVKARFGIENSHWENSERDWHINQVGPVAGLYAEYRHELIYDRLWWFATAETWLGLGGQSIDSSFSDTKAASRTFVEAFIGADLRVAPKVILRGYAGFDYQGWDYLIPGVLGVEARYELENDWGTVALGIQGKFYSTVNPTALLYAKWEITKPIARWYDNCRQESVQLVGTGIGGNQMRSVMTIADQPSTSSNRMDMVMAGLGNNSNK